MMTGRAWLHVAVLKAPKEDTEEIQNKTESPTNAKVISKDAAVEVLLSDLAEIFLGERVFFVYKILNSAAHLHHHRDIMYD